MPSVFSSLIPLSIMYLMTYVIKSETSTGFPTRSRYSSICSFDACGKRGTGKQEKLSLSAQLLGQHRKSKYANCCISRKVVVSVKKNSTVTKIHNAWPTPNSAASNHTYVLGPCRRQVPVSKLTTIRWVEAVLKFTTSTPHM